ncbi:MAG TPA: PLP-dependent aminotransferase family protein [Acetivibrio sp.]|uniref:MocR-like pyridoxine biosynthesis transcription factor PdxR n=1 Tax=Acetivibrio sp. TaxID=1872092 RepID=UPI002BD52617|nr:PLP-dependent aminotransferase family protein [Acetivibrio sp.]HOM02322.1 PLP-dependent aminotransferase family protein [Acetivibrio sp.]
MLELFKSIKLDKDSSIPLYIQLSGKIAEMIESGVLLADLKLPSIRRMSALLNVNSVTIVSCYKHLETNGYVHSRPGSGTYVAAVLPSRSAAYSDCNIIPDELYQSEDFDLINNGHIKINENTINFASATPESNLFPVENFKLVLNEVLDRDLGNAFDYQDSQGFHPLRSSVCSLLEKRNIACSEENVQIISGAQQGIDIIAKALLRQGDYVITESPTYTGAIAVFKSRGAEIADVPLEDDGPNLNILEYNLKKYRPKLIYTIPSFQNPTGISYSNGKRKAILALAERYNAYIIEDDYVSGLDFENMGFMPVKSLDKSDRVIFIESFSKIFMPGLRLGFMVVPSGLKGYIIEAKHATDISTSGLIQRAFDLYIRKGMWDEHFKLMFDIYKERYYKTVNALDRYLPRNVRFHKPGGGLNIWLDIPSNCLISSLFKAASAENVVFAPGRIFYSSTPTKLNNIRLSFAAVHTDAIEMGIKKLSELISRFDRGKYLSDNIPIL